MIDTFIRGFKSNIPHAVLTFALGLGLTALSPVAASAAQDAKLTDITSPKDLPIWTSEVADNGDVIGQLNYISTSPTAFVWSSTGGFVTLGTSSVTAIATDGNAVIGQSGNTGYYWTPQKGKVSIGVLKGGSTSTANAISANGEVVVGSAMDGPISSRPPTVAVMWTPQRGMVNLGVEYDFSSATAVSANGNAITGDWSNGILGGTGAFFWTQQAGVTYIPYIAATPGVIPEANAIAISADGNAVVGTSTIGKTGDITDAYRWTQQGGTVNLGAFGSYGSTPVAVSSDGSVVAGNSDVTFNYKQGPVPVSNAFRWTQQTGMVNLGTLGGNTADVSGMSSDGSIIVGTSDIPGYLTGTSHAFRWTQQTGMQDLNTLLKNAGVNMTGITLGDATGISANGQYIVGNGTFSTNYGVGYLAVYNPSSSSYGVTTAQQQQNSLPSLFVNERQTAIVARNMAKDMVNRMDGGSDDHHGSYHYDSALLGDVSGYIGSVGHWTMLGSVAYNAPSNYSNMQEGDIPTVAAATRYTFDDPFDSQNQTVHPFSELGMWSAPGDNLILNRSYANGAGLNMAQGATNATSWADYNRSGLVWDATNNDRLTGYGELGEQYMNFGAYSESMVNNPFPASINSGLFQMGVAEIGGSWRHDLSSFLNMPTSLTLDGGIVRSFDVHSGLVVSAPGAGASLVSGNSDTWSEYGARLDSRLTDALSLNASFNGISGSDGLGTTLLGEAALSYKF